MRPQQAWHYRALPVSLEHGEVSVLVDETADGRGVREALSVLLGLRVSVQQVSAESLQRGLAQAYRNQEPVAGSPSSEDFLAGLIREARELGASDVHLEAYGDRCRVRMRVDGALIERRVLDPADYPRYVNLVKVRANLDISQRRLPQDGRITLPGEGGTPLDLRVSVLPTLHGEKLVLRLLNSDGVTLDLADLGMDDTQLLDFREGVAKPSGIVLVSGPTGSGKTTTLYATLTALNSPARNLLTIEDPIEYTLEGINQVQLNSEIGLSFEHALRSFLRQDPDIIMIGEIRDRDTAEAAVRASLTGHLVLSTIHTNDAWGTVGRLRDIGAAPYLLSATLNTLVAQRLLRSLCTCKRAARGGDPSTHEGLPLPWKRVPEVWFEPAGCPVCHYTGYRGRFAIHEVIRVDAAERSAIQAGRDQAPKPYVTLGDRAEAAVHAGRTSIAEAYPILLTRSAPATTNPSA